MSNPALAEWGRNVGAFTAQMIETFGPMEGIETLPSTSKNLPPMLLYLYGGFPEDGSLTAFTYGLSEAVRPEWKESRPEMMVCLKTEDESWGRAAAWLVESYRSKFAFGYDTIVTTDGPISEESKMSGFFVFSPSVEGAEKIRFKLPRWSVRFEGLYPLYAGEAQLLPKIGLKRFWHADGFDMFDVRRPDLSKTLKA